MGRSYTNATRQKLFGLSGNQCAFPGCVEKLFDEKKNFIGNICHIKDLNEGGRYDPKMTDTERNSNENLILFCRNHHAITNDFEEYPVAKLQKMKKDHETKFTGNEFEISDEHLDSFTELIIVEDGATGSIIKSSGDGIAKNIDGGQKILAKGKGSIGEIIEHTGKGTAKRITKNGGTAMELNVINDSDEEVNYVCGMIVNMGIIKCKICGKPFPFNQIISGYIGNNPPEASTEIAVCPDCKSKGLN